MSQTYNVDYERDENGQWIASIRELPECHTQGHTVSEARHRIQEALEVFIDGTDTVKLVDRVLASPQ